MTVAEAADEQLEPAVLTAGANDSEADDDASGIKSKEQSAASFKSKTRIPHDKWDLKAIGPKRQKIEAALAKDTDVDFPANQLKDALESIQSKHDIQMVIDRNALSDEGISTEEEISVVMSGVSLKALLRLILEPKQLDYLVKDEYLLITTKTVANRNLETRVYQTSRLRNIDPDDLSHIIRTVVAPGRWNSTGPIKAFAGKRSRNAVVTGSTASKGNPRTDVSGIDIGSTSSVGKAADEFVKADHSNSTSNSSVAAEPDLGSVHSTPNTLVIRATQRIHEEIAELLDQLEKQQLTHQKLN